MNVEQAETLLQASANLFDRWRFNGKYNLNGIVEALSVLSEEGALFDKGGVDPAELEAARAASERLKAEKTKLARQVGAANARVAKLTKKLAELKADYEERRKTIGVLGEANVDLTRQLGEALGLIDPVDLTDETS